MIGVGVIGYGYWGPNLARCFAETHRILKPAGIYIFSSHNARVLGVWPDLSDARGLQAPLRIVRSIFKSADLSRRALRNGVYGKGQGYIRDPVHGGMDHYVSTPEAMKPQLAAAGFEVVEVLGGRFPNVTSESLTPWHYYACRKIAR